MFLRAMGTVASLSEILEFYYSLVVVAPTALITHLLEISGRITLSMIKGPRRTHVIILQASLARRDTFVSSECIG